MPTVADSTGAVDHRDEWVCIATPPPAPTSSNRYLTSTQRIRLLDSILDFSNYVEVSNFLREHPDLFDLLLETKFRVENILGRQTKLRLRMAYDPNGYSQSHLRVLLPFHGNTQEAVSFLETFEDWWIDIPDRIAGLVVVNAIHV